VDTTPTVGIPSGVNVHIVGTGTSIQMLRGCVDLTVKTQKPVESTFSILWVKSHPASKERFTQPTIGDPDDNP